MPSGSLSLFSRTLLTSSAITLCLTAMPAAAQSLRTAPAPDAPPQIDIESDAFDFESDELQYDRELGVLKAVGNVEIIQGERILNADIVTYNERTDVMAASGNVSLLEPTGEVLFAEYVELTPDLRKGLIEKMLIILADKSRIAAIKGVRDDGNRTTMERAIYTACSLCEDDPEKPPLWQLKAIQVIHDKERQTIEYKDAWMEVAGVPVAYTPYLIHPDPTVKRRSGFLPPSVEQSSDLGTVTKVPYFWAISEQTDATITPAYASDQGPGMHTEIRHRMLHGSFDLEGSVAVENDDDVLGHVDSEFRYDLDKTWRTGVDIQRTEDDTYARRYGYHFDQTLTTRTFVEGFRQRNYALADAYLFQSLEADDEDEEIPVVMPLLEYEYVGKPDRIGGYTQVLTNFTSLMRRDGQDTQRLSAHGGWHLPLMGPLGTTMKFNAVVKSDLYYKNDFVPEDSNTEDDGFEYRITPEASLDLAYPLVKSKGGYTQIFEPRAQVVISPNSINDDAIPNEDSQVAELDDTRLFSHSRYAGFDQVEEGPRFNYGLHWGVFGPEGGSTTAFIGQSYRIDENSSFDEGSGLNENLSDLVLKAHVRPGDFAEILYRARINNSNYKFERNEVSANIGRPLLSVSTTYSFFARQPNSEFDEREEISYSASSQFTEYWRSSFSGTTDLDDGGELRQISAALVYEDECLIFSTVAQRSFFEDRDLEPSDSITFRISFKTLGDFTTGVDP